MIIGFDGKRAVSNMTGLGNYSRLVIEEVGKKFRHLEKEDDENKEAQDVREKEEFGMYIGSGKKKENKDWRLMVYTPEMRKNVRLEPIRRLENIEFRFPPAMGLSGSLWRTFGITNNLQSDGCNIYHGLSNELPLNIKSSGVKSIVTIHDVIYRRLPYCYSLPDRLIYDFKYGKSCMNADKIIAVSECTKRDIIEYYGIPEEKIDVIYQGCSDNFRKEISAEDKLDLKRRIKLPTKYIIQVGTVERRKNLELTIRALTTLPEDIALVVVGGDKDSYLPKMRQLAQRLGMAERIHFLGKVNFADLPILYNMAEVSVYPSHYEGFGIPVIESIESGTPVVATKGSCLEEAGGNGALYVDAYKPEELAQAIESITSNPDKRRDMLEEGKNHVKKFDNDKMADRIIDSYRTLYNSKKI